MKESSHWIVNAWRKQDADAQVIRVQKYSIFCLLILSLLLGIGWISAPSRLTCYLPPDLQNGALIKPGEIPLPLIYSFAYEVWQEINYWPSNGEVDYPTNIGRYMAYLTPAFKAELLNDAMELKIAGQAQRVRYLEGASGAAFEVTNVKVLTRHDWEVDLLMRLTEYKNNL